MSYTRTELRPVRDTIIPRFHIEAVEDPIASEREGRPIYRSEERVQFLNPASPNQPVEIVNQGHKERWPDQYAAFKRGEEMAVDGTPLEQWPILKKPQVYELKAKNLFTVEQVANMADTAVQGINFGHRLRELARAYLDDAEQLKLTQQQSAVIEKQNVELAELRQKVSELSAIVGQLHGQMMRQADAPSAIDIYVPGDHDPAALAAQARGAQEAGVTSALADLPAPRRRRGQESE